MRDDDYKLSDSVITHIAQLLQLAIVTGTDIVDQFRMIRLEPSELVSGELVLTKSYSVQSQDGIDRLVTQAERMAAQAEKDDSNPQVQ